MNGELDGAALLRACREGEAAERRAAFEELGGFLLRIARERLRSKPELADRAEECVQESLLVVWRKLEAGGGPDRPERFPAWCAAVVVHKVYDMLRRQGYSRQMAAALEAGGIPDRARRVPRAAQRSLEGMLEADDDGPPLRLPDARALDPETDAAEREAYRALVASIRDHPQLSEDSKQVLSQGFLAEMDDAELASRLGTSRGNVQVIRSRNLSKLRDDQALLDRLRTFYETPKD